MRASRTDGLRAARRSNAVLTALQKRGRVLIEAPSPRRDSPEPLSADAAAPGGRAQPTKVGVVGSNPIARSRLPNIIRMLRDHGDSCVPIARSGEAWGKQLAGFSVALSRRGSSRPKCHRGKTRREFARSQCHRALPADGMRSASSERTRQTHARINAGHILCCFLEPLQKPVLGTRHSGAGVYEGHLPSWMEHQTTNLGVRSSNLFGRAN
jgi:hypothetical protein